MENKKTNLSGMGSELGTILFVTGILLILFIPIPSALLDLLLIINFSWALIILLLCFYTDKPLSFSTFPALLLVSTLFRLALNISATRLILSEGDAGRVISAVGQYVIHGNYVMGMVVFLILIIVQFIVVTNGAQRVAEVAARFTLDSMPGKQMSIDADLNMGLISQETARERRSQIEKEANFYGAMDGASKFVKGDAIAGILIMLVDIIGGLAIGVLQKNMTFSEAIQNYSLLTVGDGLVTQIPALIISTATGIIVTRAATDTHLGSEIVRQISTYPKSLVIVSCSLALLLFIKGIPGIPVFLVLAFFIVCTWFAMKSQHQAPDDSLLQEETLYQKIHIHPIEIQLNPSLYENLLSKQDEFLSLVQQIRERLAFDLGLVIPEVKLRSEAKLNYPFYRISVQGIHYDKHPLYLDKFLAIAASSQKAIENKVSGIEVSDPSYGLAAQWIERAEKEQAEHQGFTVCEPLSILATHLQEVIQSSLAELLSRNEVETLLDQSDVCKLRDELIPAMLQLGQVQKILQNLLSEKVSVRHTSLILEVLLEHAKVIQDVNQLTELVRIRLSSQICQRLINNQGLLPVLTLAPVMEQTLAQNLTNNHLHLDPSQTEKLIKSLSLHVEKMLGERKKPVLLCSPMLRRQLKLFTQRIIPHLTILSLSEIPIHIQIEPFGVIQ
ncbi:flagellar biosynthesis protein FlhA [Legionella quinlivanii]|uniref:flagellar biosynthesis protein FlhA n=1 Tax=Legionella quinlivanii TaxID=45073 RepID=UPI002244B02C|nr:flagellar biosynthesis protein FlhA [Legionella quinlivanii]MCW8451417.1 flagellar biosynthesis protein FlhA [Legionella quinlivanii]